MKAEQLRDAVVARWGSEVAPGGVIDRAAIAQRTFSSDRGAPVAGERRVAAGRRAHRRLAGADARAGRPPPRAAVVEVPLLFESGMDDLYDATIAVVADEPVRRARAAERGHALARERAARQLSQEEKARRATFVVHNDGSEEELERALSAMLDKLAG